MATTVAHFSDDEILAARGAKNHVDPFRPYAFLVEPELSARREVVDVATIFLTNRECPFRCLMCDLWQNTTDERVPAGAIPAQIDFALSNLPAARHIKLYNSGNFFDAQAIPPGDLPLIARRVGHFERVIVENHPKLCGPVCATFREQIETELEIALGLETAHPAVLRSLNKSMTLADFDRAVERLLNDGIHVRAFILLKPPFLAEEEAIDWALKSIDYAFERGVGCCSVIPTRGGNGIMERLAATGKFAPPRLASIERVLAESIRRGRGRVFMDLWDARKFATCLRCADQRIDRLRRMNLTQQVMPLVECNCEAAP